MKEILKFKEFNKLKKIYRMNSVGNRKESSAEHTWSSLILADYFLEKINLKINRLKIYEILIYHDVVEIQAGDTPLSPYQNNNQNKAEIELKAAKILKNKLPKLQAEKFYKLFLEFEEQKTIEARFAVAIDKLDAVIQEIDYKKDWKGWNKKFLLQKKEKYFIEFKEIHKEFLKIVKYLEKEGYFNQ